jgi:hypothetical protein
VEFQDLAMALKYLLVDKVPVGAPDLGASGNVVVRLVDSVP